MSESQKLAEIILLEEEYNSSSSYSQKEKILEKISILEESK